MSKIWKCFLGSSRLLKSFEINQMYKYKLLYLGGLFYKMLNVFQRNNLYVVVAICNENLCNNCIVGRVKDRP